MIDLIKEKLPQHLHQLASTFKIPEKYLKEDPELIILILESRSLDSVEEKQNWFDLMDIMNDEQVGKLKDILTREKEKIADIEKKYEDKKKEIAQKYQNKFNIYNQNSRVQKLRATERSQREEEIEHADSLLDNL